LHEAFIEGEEPTTMCPLHPGTVLQVSKSQ